MLPSPSSWWRFDCVERGGRLQRELWEAIVAKFQCDWCHDGAQTRALASLIASTHDVHVSSITEEIDRFSLIFAEFL